MSLCDCRDVFGRPNEGVHAARIGRFAAVDLGLTVLAAGGLAYYYEASAFGYVLALIIAILLGVLFHWAFCVDTAFNRMLGLAETPKPRLSFV